ncbi:MAG TPA: UDP-3-O-(3-hydroxymyristoyl)glucosamine N-acyltransferase, partial [Candidatus Binataceae bacterium]|nr:UDP-3-O-(3-hydroxymyristoyl)glucosamine N-acyltransferase [Candidatus Binataceae bacterium]
MKLSELARRLGLEPSGAADPEIFAPAPAESAAPGMIIFIDSPRYAPLLLRSSASAALVTREFAAGAKCPVLISPNPRADFARTVAIFFPAYRPAPGIDPTARIAADVKLGAGASIGAFVSIGEAVTIGRGAVIHSHVSIYPRVTIGDDFVCHTHAAIREGATIGNRVTIHNGAVIGAEGFGFVEDADGLVKIPQVGSVVLEDDVEVGAKSTIDRAMLGATILHRG